MLRILYSLPVFIAATIFGSNAVTAQQVGQDLYQIQCVACHGKEAEGNTMLNAPALAGQQATYTVRQLKNYKMGLRGIDERDNIGRQMAAFATALDDESRSLLAGYLSELPRKAPQPIAGDLKHGEKYYQAYCGSCHGPGAGGNEMLNSPDLRGLDASYLKRQYQNFLDGARGAHPDDKYGRQMALISSGLKDPDTVDAVIAYIISVQ